MKIISNKFKKENINDLPRALFDGPIHVVESLEDCERAVELLRQAPILGLDTETKPCFQARRQNKVALLQIGTHETCYLIRLNKIGLPQCVVDLLSDPEILKIGLSLQDDFRQLNRLAQFHPAGYVELQDYVKPFGIADLSLQKLYANIMGGRISKGQQLTNWEADVLTEAQQGYAATDAWACILLYEELNRMRLEGFHVAYEPDEVPQATIVIPKEKHEKAETDEEVSADQAQEETALEVSTEDPVAPAEQTEKKSAKNRKKKPARAKKKPEATPEAETKTQEPAAVETPQQEQTTKKRKKKPARKKNEAKGEAETPASPVLSSKSNDEDRSLAAQKPHRKNKPKRKPKRQAPTLIPLDEPKSKASAEPKSGLFSRLAKKLVDKLT